MRAEFIEALQAQKTKGEAFCLATVVKVEGSSSARTGSKAIFDSAGRNVFGWVGGGCAERYVGEQSVESIAERRTRVVLADLDDEIFGLGIACGGKMEVFIEPIFPEERLALPLSPALSGEAEFLAQSFGWKIEWREGPAPIASIEDLILALARGIATARGRDASSLRARKGLPARFVEPREPIRFERLVVLGKGRIVEAVARLATLLRWPVTIYAPGLEAASYPRQARCECLRESYDEMSFGAGDAVLIASHHALDPEFVAQAERAGASYVGMIGSRKRALEVLAAFGVGDGEEAPARVFAPTGLDIDARSPDEIALSIVAEILRLQQAKP